MSEHEPTEEKPIPQGDDAVPDSDQVESGDDQPGGDTDHPPVEDPSSGDSA